MKIKAEIVIPHIYVLTYPTQYDLAMTLVRVQEFYESQKFRNKYFTLEQYMDCWCKSHGGSFTYPSMWNGFNIPGSVLRKWIEVCTINGDSLREREKNFIRMVGELMKKEGMEASAENIEKIYVVGVHKNAKDIEGIINHESSHAFYRLYPEYRKSCKEILKKLSEDDKKNMIETLTRFGYNKKVMMDEIQAYSSTGSILNNGLLSEFKNNFNAFKNGLVKKNLK